VNVLEFIEAIAAVCVVATLYAAWRARRGRRPRSVAKSWGIAAAVAIVASVALELYLRMG